MDGLVGVSDEEDSGMRRHFIVYGLLDPRTQVIRYVGRSINGLKRPNDTCRRGWKLHTKCGNWLKGLKNAGIFAQIEVLEEFPCQEDVGDGERFWIASILAAGGDLLNLTDGGDGRLGYLMPEETRRKIGLKNSASLLGNIPWNKGVVGYSTPRTREAGLKRLGRVQSLQEKERRRTSLMGRQRTRDEVSKTVQSLLTRGGVHVRSADGRVFNSAGQAALHYRVSRYTIKKEIARGTFVEVP